MKAIKEWYFQAPWGKVALMSWGNPNGEPILLMHGRQDSLVTFLPLLELLLDSYYYVGFDLPGHGKSDSFPVGVAVQRITFVAVIEMIIKHLGWKKFIYIAHSMGSELGLFYNTIHPNQVEKMVFLDPGPSFQQLVAYDPRTYFEQIYEKYYNNYIKYSRDDRVYSKRSAVEAIMRNRNMNERQAEVLLSRNLIKIGEDKYRLSWDKRLKVLIPPRNTLEYCKELFTRNLPPALFICSSDSEMNTSKEAKKQTIELMHHFGEKKNVRLMTVKGGHDVHFTNPERFIDVLNTFLNKSFIVSKI